MMFLKQKPVQAPWRVTVFGDATYIVEEHIHSEVIAGIAGDFRNTYSESTAQIICAAPFMLEVLEELIESAEYWSEYDVPLGIVERMKKVISMAKGENLETVSEHQQGLI